MIQTKIEKLSKYLIEYLNAPISDFFFYFLFEIKSILVIDSQVLRGCQLMYKLFTYE